MPKLHRERVMSKIVPMQYEGHALHFTDDGWFNATEAAAKFSRNPNDWVRLPATQSYLAAFVRKYGNIPYLKTRRGGCGVNQWKIFGNRLRTVKVATMTPPKRKVSCMVSLSSLASTPQIWHLRPQTWRPYPCAETHAWRPCLCAEIHYLCAKRRFHGVAPRRACLAWYLHVLPDAANQPWSLHLKSHALCARQQILLWLSARQSQLFQGLQIFAACRTRVIP